MDSRDASIQGHQQPPQGIIMTPPSYGYPQQHLQNNPHANSASNLIPNPTYAFNSVSAPFDARFLGQHQQQQEHHQHQNGSPSGGSGAATAAEPGRRRRGRPRKYPPDGTGLVLSSNSQLAAGGSGQKELGDVNGEGSQGRRQRGRPPSSGKKQLDALGGAAGSGFTPHVIMISPREDIVSKMVEFCQEGPRTIIILSAYGAVYNALIRPSGATDESGFLRYEGCNDIISLSGPFMCVNYNESQSNNFEFTVVLSTSDGKSSGGRVVGQLIAATNVQIIAASFVAEQKKSNASIPPASSPLPSPAVTHLLTFGESATANGTATDSSEDNDGTSGSHSLCHIRRPYNNAYHMHSMPMYQPRMGWGISGMGDVHQNNNG